jgi:hypothetical protein
MADPAWVAHVEHFAKPKGSGLSFKHSQFLSRSQTTLNVTPLGGGGCWLNRFKNQHSALPRHALSLHERGERPKYFLKSLEN